jgi:hypothetical protein
MEQLARDLGILLSGFMTPIRIMGLGLLFLAIWTGFAGNVVLFIQDLARPWSRASRTTPTDPAP